MQRGKIILFHVIFFLSGFILLAKGIEEGIIEIVINESHREESFPIYFGEDLYPLIEIEELVYIVGIKNYEVNSGNFNYRINGEWSKIEGVINYQGKNLISAEKISQGQVEWDPDNFQLKINLPFELPKDFLLERERERRQLDRKVDEDDLIKEQWKPFTPGVLKVSYGKSDLSRGTSYTSLNYVNQFIYGTSELNISGNDNDFNVDTYRWKRYLGDEREVVIGDSYINAPSNTGDLSSFRGLSVFKRNSWDTSLNVDNKSISGFASNGIVAELYENGILKEYQVVRNGMYEFDIETTGGNRSYEVWLYQEDGEIEKKLISIYGNVDLLDRGEIDFDYQLGQDRDNSDFTMYNTNLYYGVNEDLTIKFGGYNTIYESEEKHYFNIEPTFRIGSTGNWSHLVVGNYVQNSSNSSENFEKVELYSSNSNITNTFGYERYKGFSRDEINENYDEKQYWRTSFPFMNINTSLSYEREKKADSNEKVDRYGVTMYDSFFKGKISASGGLQREKVSKKDTNSDYTTEMDLGISYNIGHKNLMEIIDTVGLEYDSKSQKASTYGIYFRRRSRLDRNLEYYFSLKKEDGHSYGELNVTYKLGDKINIRSSNNRDRNGNTTSGVELNTAVNFGSPKGEKIYYTDYMGDSNVSGQVFIDINNNGIMDEGEMGVSDFRVKSNSSTWVSNEQGQFYMPLLSSNTHHKIHIKNENTNILNYSYEKKYNVRTLPGGELKLYIPVVPLKSMVGILEFDSDMYIEDIWKFIGDTEIKIIGIKSELEEIIELTDEFFMKDLPVGTYSMEFVSKKTKKTKGNIHYFDISYDEDELEEYIDVAISLEENDGYRIQVY